MPLLLPSDDQFKRVKIVATVGPTTAFPEALESLILSGVNVFRLNFSHGTHDDHRYRFETIREIAKKCDRSIGILADLQGPKLRVGDFRDGKIEVKKGQSFRLDLSPDLGDAARVQLPHQQIFDVLFPGAQLLIDDGKVALEVTAHGKDFAQCTIKNDGFISNHKGVNFPSAVLNISSLTEKDLKDLDFALSLGVDFIALSFVQRPEDVHHARSIIGDRALIVSKLEKPSIVTHLDAIVAASDAIMVARGDLGVELPAEQVPVLQKKIIAACRAQQKPVIIATQMLESMISSPVPTRAEVSDVANAVYDSADAVMLSAETANGSYPIAAVTIMAATIKNVESDGLLWERLQHSSCLPYGVSSCAHTQCTPLDSAHALSLSLAHSAQLLARHSGASFMLSLSKDMHLALAIASMRSCIPHIALVPTAALAQKLVLSFCTQASVFKPSANIHGDIAAFLKDFRQQHKGVLPSNALVTVALDSSVLHDNALAHALYTIKLG